MSLRETYISACEILPVAIANGASLTDAVNLGGLRLFGVVMPAEWTTANLTFQMSPDDGATWVSLKDQNGNEVAAAASVSTFVVLNPSQFTAVQYLRVRSGTAGTPVAQGAARSLQLVLRSV